MTPQPTIAQHYARMQIATAAGSKLICMLHQRCVQLIHQSTGSENFRQLLDKAQNIIVHFERTLIMGDEVAESLFYLYDYCYCCMETNDPNEHQKALSIMTLLRDTFDLLLHSPSPQTL